MPFINEEIDKKLWNALDALAWAARVECYECTKNSSERQKCALIESYKELYGEDFPECYSPKYTGDVPEKIGKILLKWTGYRGNEE